MSPEHYSISARERRITTAGLISGNIGTFAVCGALVPPGFPRWYALAAGLVSTGFAVASSRAVYRMGTAQPSEAAVQAQAVVELELPEPADANGVIIALPLRQENAPIMPAASEPHMGGM